MTILEDDFWKYSFMALAILSAIAICFAIYKFEKHSKLCKDQGGTMVELTTGYACVKLERVNIK